MTKKELREQLGEFARVFMREFLVMECRFVPSVDSFVRKVGIDSSLLDFFSFDELVKEFRNWFGLSKKEFDEIVREIEKEEMVLVIKDGSREGILDWLIMNVEKLLRDEDFSWCWFVRARKDGKERFVIVLPDERVDERKVVKLLGVVGYSVVERGIWKLRIGMKVESLSEEDEEGLIWFLEAVKQWRNVGVYLASELKSIEVEEGVDRISMDEAVPLEVVYRESERYRRQQPGQQDRIEAGERMVENVLSVRFVPFFGTKVLDIYAEVMSEERNKAYTVSMKCLDVDLSEEFSPETPFKLLDTKSKEVFYSSALTPDTEVVLRCGCDDFYFRFAYFLRQRKALLGRLKPYVRKTVHRKSQNVPRAVTACKHVFALLELLTEVGLVRMSRVRMMREVDLVRRLGRLLS